MEFSVEESKDTGRSSGRVKSLAEMIGSYDVRKDVTVFGAIQSEDSREHGSEQNIANASFSDQEQPYSSSDMGSEGMPSANMPSSIQVTRVSSSELKPNGNAE